MRQIQLPAKIEDKQELSTARQAENSLVLPVLLLNF